MFGAPGTQSPRVLGGRYRLIKIAGKGGMGVVWLAWDQSVERQVAVKLVLPAHSEDEHLQRLARLERERRVLIELSQHPNVVTLFDILMEPIGYVMEWIEGYDLEEWLRANPGPQPPEVVASIFAPMLDAVGYAHERGVIHRDIKSSNVFLQALGDRIAVRVMDFGLARIVQQESNITTGRLIVGTPQYMAPEQILGNESTAATDIYSLGVLLYECLTGSLPLESTGESPIPLLLSKVNNELPSPLEKYPELPEALADVVIKATRRAPEERFASCAEFAEALFDALPIMPSRTRPLIEASTLGVLPELQSAGDSIALAAMRGESSTSELSPEQLYGYVTESPTNRYATPDLSGKDAGNATSNVTAVTPISAVHRNDNASPNNEFDFIRDEDSFDAFERGKLSGAVQHIQRQILAASPEKRRAIGAILLICLLAIVSISVLTLGSLVGADKQDDESQEAYDDTVPFPWVVRGVNPTNPSVTSALRYYTRTLHHWNDGRRAKIIEGHRAPMRCYYNTANLPREQLPLQSLVRTSLGLPSPPFQPEEIFVTSSGRDYVTFVESGVAGDQSEPYVRIIQMVGNRNATWRISVESSEPAHDCYPSFDTHYHRWLEARPVPAE